MAPGGAAVGSAAHVLGGCLGWAAPGRELRGLLRASAALFCLDEAEGLLGVGAGGREGGQAKAWGRGAAWVRTLQLISAVDNVAGSPVTSGSLP